MRRTLYILWQCLWGFPQSLVGAVIFLLNLRRPHRSYHGAVVTEWKYKSSVSLGLFVFLAAAKSPEAKQRILVHEYGHKVQSLMLGPLYLIGVGLPSVLWAGLPQMKALRRKKNISYYSVYPERWADRLGERITGEQSQY